MTVINSREFATNQEKYFDLAENEDICIKRGAGLFHLIYQPVETRYPKQGISEPDDNLRNAITAEELLKRVHKVVRQQRTARPDKTK